MNNRITRLFLVMAAAGLFASCQVRLETDAKENVVPKTNFGIPGNDSFSFAYEGGIWTADNSLYLCSSCKEGNMEYMILIDAPSAPSPFKSDGRLSFNFSDIPAKVEFCKVSYGEDVLFDVGSPRDVKISVVGQMSSSEADVWSGGTVSILIKEDGQKDILLKQNKISKQKRLYRN